MQLVANKTPAPVISTLATMLDEWGDIALRTLVWGKKEVSQSDFVKWAEKYEAVCAKPDEIAKMKKGLPNEITATQAALESNLTLQGSTAIEDKLQVRTSHDLPWPYLLAPDLPASSP